MLDKKIISILEEYKIVGLSVSVFQDDKIIFKGGYGWADIEARCKTTPDTIFRVASISKMVTATALMQLYEQEKFNLDDDIGGYLGYSVRNPKYPSAKITFRHLLTHTSSIVDDGSYDRIIEEFPGLLPKIEIKDMLVPKRRYYSPDNYADYEAGSGFSYSNFGAAIQGSLVETISGKTFDSYCAEYIFKPLNMDSSFDVADIKNRGNIGVLYRPGDSSGYFTPALKFTKIKRKPRSAPLGNALGMSPAGGLWANVLDISKFMMAHLSKGKYKDARILNADTADMMHGMEWFGIGLCGFYKQKGLGFHITDDFIHGQRFIGHSAEAYGLIGDAYFEPDSKFGIVFLINGGLYTDKNPFFSVQNQLAKALYDEFASVAGERRKICGKINNNIITVNDRKLFLPVPVASYSSKEAELGIIFVPAITAADALKVKIELNELNGNNILTFTKGSTWAELIVNKPEMLLNGQKVPLLKAPYQAEGHIMIPLKELINALNVKVDMKFLKK